MTRIPKWFIIESRACDSSRSVGIKTKASSMRSFEPTTPLLSITTTDFVSLPSVNIINTAGTVIIATISSGMRIVEIMNDFLRTRS